MKFPFRAPLTGETKSYAAHTPEAMDAILDCSLGVNPYGFPPQVAEAMGAFDPALLSEYPHSRVLHQALCAYWPGLAEDEITLANGSVCGLYYLNNIFSMTERDEVVGFIPSFTDMVESVKCFGMKYVGVPLRLKESGEGHVWDLIAAITDKTAFLYLDRPNNPTGQAMALCDLEKLLQAAQSAGCYVLADEAYGDFLPREESAMTLWGKYDNLIVLRTFSKGFGLANLRCGYIAAPAELTAMMARTTNPYLLSDMERRICAAALDYPAHPVAHAGDFAAVKQAIRGSIGKRLEMLCTDDRVPICTLVLQEAGDLQGELLQRGVLTVSGREFDALDERYVRLRIPPAQQVDRLLQAIALVEQGK